MHKRFDDIPKEIKDKCIADVIARVQEVDVVEVGIITAQEIIDIVTNSVGAEIYNKGLRDAKKLLQERMADVEVEIDILEKH